MENNIKSLKLWTKPAIKSTLGIRETLGMGNTGFDGKGQSGDMFPVEPGS